jgi:hypothetical protein
VGKLVLLVTCLVTMCGTCKHEAPQVPATAVYAYHHIMTPCTSIRIVSSCKAWWLQLQQHQP